MRQRRRVGIIGAGWVTQHHLPAWSALSERAEVVAIADPQLDAAKTKADAFGIKAVYSSAAEMLDAEDIDIVDVKEGMLSGTVTNITFKGVHYDVIVDFKGFKWLIQTTDFCYVGSYIGIKIDPDGIHIMKKSAYSGKFGDYSSYSAQYDEIGDVDYAPEEESTEDDGYEA